MIDPQRVPPLLPRKVADRAVDDSLREIRAAIKALVDSPMVAGRFLDVTLSAGVSTPVQHGLGRRIRGYIPVRMSASSRIFDGTPGGAERIDTHWLEASHDVTATLWVF